jgi:nitroreductase
VSWILVANTKKREELTMGDFFEVNSSRQSCRSFTGQPVEHEKLVKCVEAALLTPSGCNSQPWSFVVVEKPELLPEIALCGQNNGINSFTDKAGAFIFVIEEYAELMPNLRAMLDSRYFAKGDLGAATLTLCLAAEALGLGTCIIGMFNREKIAELVGLPKETLFASMIAVGYASKPEVRKKQRKSLAETVRFV